MTAAPLQVLADLRERWLERGVDWWSDDPVSRPGETWWRIDRLAADDAAIAAAVDGWQQLHAIDDRKAAASLFAKRLGSILAFPPTVAWMSWRRVPIVASGATWIRLGTGGPDRIAFDEPTVAVLPDDHLAGRPGVVVTGEAELLELLRTSVYDDTMGTVIDAVHRVERTGRRHLWGNLALTAVNSALWTRGAATAWDDGRRLAHSDERLRRTIEIVPAVHAEAGPFALALRRTCCLAYADVDHGYCASCSLLDRDARLDDLDARIGAAWARSRADGTLG